VAVNEQDIIQRIKAGSLAPKTSDRNLENRQLQADPTLPTYSGAPDRVEPIEGPIQALRAGAVSGAANISAQNRNFRAAIATLRGNTEDAENILREANRLETEAGIPLAGMESFGEFLDEPTAGGFFNQVASATGQFVPSLAASLAEAAVVGAAVAGGTILTGGTATPALLAGAGAAITRKQALKTVPSALRNRKPNILKEDAEDLLNKQYKNVLAEKQGRPLPFPKLPTDKKAQQDLADIYGQLRSQKLGRRFTQGALAGAYSQEQRMGTGIAFSDYADQGMKSPQDAIAAIGQGQVFGAIGLGSEAATAAVIARQLKRGGKLKVRTGDSPLQPNLAPSSTFFGDLTKAMAVTSISEGVAEGLQEELSVQQKFRIDDDYTKANAKLDRLNAIFAGFFGGLGVGSALGAGTGVLNKARELTNYSLAEGDAQKMFLKRYKENELGRIMRERQTALKAQFEFTANPQSNKDSNFIDIDSSKDVNFSELENVLPNAIRVASPQGAYFTTNERKAREFQNLVTLYPFNTEVQDAWLAENGLGYSRTRKTGDDIVVGIFDKQANELVHYQSASSTYQNDFEKAKNKMQEILGNADPARYEIITQTLKEHADYRTEGLDSTATTPFTSVRDLFQEMDDQSEMNTSEDDTGEEGVGNVDTSVSATAQDIRKGRVSKQEESGYTTYIQDVYKLPINFSDLAFFVNLTSAATKGAQTVKDITSVISKAAPQIKQRLARIYNAITNAGTTIGSALTNEDARYLTRVKEKPLEEMGLLLDEIAELGSGVETRDPITSSMSRMAEEGADVRNIPLVGVTEILKRTNVQVENQEDVSSTKVDIGSESPLITKRGGSGTVENPYINIKTKEPWSIQGTITLPDVPIELRDSKNKGDKTKGGWAAYNRKDNVIYLDESELKRTFDEKAWTKPKVKGVNALPRNLFTTLPEWRKFIIAHESAHAKFPQKAKESTPDYENRMNEVALKSTKVGDPKATASNIAGVRQYIHPSLRQEFENNKQYYSRDLLQAFELKSKDEAVRTEGIGYMRIVDTQDLPALKTASKKGEVFQASTKTKPDARTYKAKKVDKKYIADMKAFNDRKYVLVRMQPEEKQFIQATGRNPNEVRNIKQDLITRVEQAKARVKGKGYKSPIYFTAKDLEAGLSEGVPGGRVDIAVLLEGITSITKRTRRRDQDELKTSEAQRVAALLDAVVLMEEQGFALEYYPDTVRGTAAPVTITSKIKRKAGPGERRGPTVGPPQETVSVNVLLDNIITSPAGAQVLKVVLETKDPEKLSAQLAELKNRFALTELSFDMFSKDDFALLNTPFLNFPQLDSKLQDAQARQEQITFNRALVAPFLKDFEQNTMAEMSLDQLVELKENVEDFISISWPMPFEGEGKYINTLKGPFFVSRDKKDPKMEGGSEAEAARLYAETLQTQDKVLLNFLKPIASVIAAIESQDIRNEPGKLQEISAPLGQPVTRDVAFGSPTGEVEIRQQQVNIPANRPNLAFRGAGGSINREVPIETYIDDIAAIASEKESSWIEDTGLFNTDDPTMGAPADNSAVKMDIQDRNLFESYQEQEGKEYRGRNKYYELSRTPNVKPSFKDNRKYIPGTLFLLQETGLKRRRALSSSLSPSDTSQRAKLPFRQQILKGLTTAARQLGLSTNLKVLSAETNLKDSQLPNSIKETLDMKDFEQRRQELLDNENALAMTLQYRHFDVILMKTNAKVNEGAYYAAYLKELGNSFVFQELEKSLKVPATRKALLKAFEEIKKGDTVPANYSDPKKGFYNFVADQYSLSIREKLGLNVDGTTYSNIQGPAKSWFKRLANSQQKLFNALGPAQRKRLEVNDTFQDYADQIKDSIQNPTLEQVPYEVKAKIETQIESLLGPQTYTDKQIRKVLDNAGKLLTTKNLPTWLRNLLITTDTRFRQMGPAGVAIADFFNLDPRTTSKAGRAGIITLKTRRANSMLNDVAKILGVEDGWFYSTFNEEQKAILNEAANDEIDTKDLTNPQAVKVREYLQALYFELGLESMGVAERKNYFPRVIAVAEIASDPAKQAQLKKLLKGYNPKATDSQIQDAVQSLINKNNGDIEFTAKDEIEIGTLQARKELYKNVPNKALMDLGLADAPEISLKKYFDKLALRYEFEQSGGTQELDRLLSKLTPAQQEEARDMIDSMFGKIKPIQSGLLKKANDIGLTLNIVTLLGLTVIASLQDTAGPVLRARGTAKVSDVFGVIKDMIKSPQEAADIAREIGVIGVDAMSSFFVLAGEQDFMSQSAKNVSDAWFRVTGLEAYTRFTRVFATGMGTRFLQNHARKAQAGDTTSQLYLKELNVTAEEVLAWEKGKADKATREKVNESLAQFVDESIVRPNPAQRPQYANDPRYALVWQLKSFFYAYGKTIVFPTLKESHRGFVNNGAGAGVMPILLMAGMLLPITMLGLEIREAFKAFLAWVLPGVSPDDPGVNYFKTDDMSTGQYMTEIIDRSGMLGPASLALPVFLESHRYGNPFWVPPLGPTAERVWDGVTLDWRPSDFIPVYSQLDTRALGR
tara:strand:- start:2846 stop:10426 length:7581 start_codon:yes stop_codon:yes gene_type:complete